MPWAYICSKHFLLGLFLGELIFGWASYWKEFYVSKWVRLTIKQLAITVHGLIFGRAYDRKDFCVQDLGGFFFRTAYFYSYLFIFYFFYFLFIFKFFFFFGGGAYY